MHNIPLYTITSSFPHSSTDERVLLSIPIPSDIAQNCVDTLNAEAEPGERYKLIDTEEQLIPLYVVAETSVVSPEEKPFILTIPIPYWLAQKCLEAYTHQTDRKHPDGTNRYEIIETQELY